MAYEVYGERNLKTGEARCTSEQLVRRFPLDFTEQPQEEEIDLLNEFNSSADLKPSKPNAAGLFTRIVAPVRELGGPDRALLLKGEFDAAALALLADMIALYRNLVALHDSKERDPLTKLPNRQSFDAACCRSANISGCTRFRTVARRRAPGSPCWISTISSGLTTLTAICTATRCCWCLARRWKNIFDTTTFYSASAARNLS